MNLCKCGCGQSPSSPGASWLPGHNTRSRPKREPNTHCPGCGKELPPEIAVRWRCSNCRTRQRRARVAEARQILGDRCRRCGIRNPLHFDHVNDDATKRNKTANGRYRRLMSAEQAEITKILNTGQSDRLQLLCPNCNHLKQHDRTAYNQPPTYGPLAGPQETIS